MCNIVVLNIHPTLLPLPIRHPSFLMLPTKLCYPLEVLIALVGLLLWVICQHLLQEFQVEVSKAHLILLVNLPLQVKPSLQNIQYTCHRM